MIYSQFTTKLSTMPRWATRTPSHTNHKSQKTLSLSCDGPVNPLVRIWRRVVSYFLCSKFSTIFQFLAGILMGHIGTKNSSDSELQFGSKCSIRTRSRNWDIVQYVSNRGKKLKYFKTYLLAVPMMGMMWMWNRRLWATVKSTKFTRAQDLRKFK